jgi:HEAT repeat protein
LQVLADEEEGKKKMSDVPIQTTIHRIRAAYTYNPHFGLAGWFDVFDWSLLQKAFPGCQALLDEMHQGVYQLDEGERTYIISRKAALLLCQGITSHLEQKFAEAHAHYEASRRLYHDLNDANGEGQVIFALDELQKLRNGEKTEWQQLEHVANAPWVLGNSSTLLVERLRSLPVMGQLQVIAAARQQGHNTPLLEALAVNTVEVQAAAASSLAWIKPGPDYSHLLAMLPSSNWIVRWQAVLILQHHSQEDEKEFALHKMDVRKALTNQLEQGELDPMVRRDIASLLQHIGNTEDTPYLIALIDDEDPDVRASAIEALGAIKDKKAINALSHVRDGVDFRGNKIARLAEVAVQNISGKITAQDSKNASEAEVVQSSSSWWWVGLLIVLPLVAPFLTYSYSITAAPTIFKGIERLIPGRTFDWLLVGGLLWGWLMINSAKNWKRIRRFHPREDVATVSFAALYMAVVIVSTLTGEARITLPGLLLIATAVGIAIGIPVGLVSNVLYGSCTKLVATVVIGLIFVVAAIVAAWTSNHFGGFAGFALAYLAYLLTYILLVSIAPALYFLLGFFAGVIAAFGPIVVILVFLAGSLLYALHDLKISIFVGLTCILAIIVAELVKRSAGARPVPQLSRGMGIILAIVYMMLVWVYFFGGAKLLSG